MLSPTPAVRAAIFGLVVVTAVSLAGGALHLASIRALAYEAATDELAVRADAVAGALRTPDARAPVDRMAGDAALVVYDAGGRPVRTSDPDVVGVADWGRTAAGLPGHAGIASIAGERYTVASADLAGGGAVVALRAAPDGLPDGTLLQATVTVASLWGLIVGVFVVVTWYTGPRSATQLALLGERIAQGEADGDALIRHAALWLGPLAEAFGPVAARFRQLRLRARDVDQHVAALYQINPHYVLLCTMDGEIVEGNPAFYAATGLPPEAVRGGRIEALQQTFPVEPLLELAGRSLREGSAVSGIEYGIIDRDDETRPVEVSLRGFEIEGRAYVLFQATDQAHARRLERRVAAFTDTLDLMVDQRVHQLTAGQQAVNRVLDAAGVVIASFDAGGATSRWNGAARALTGRDQASVPHFAAVTDAFGLPAGERAAFTQWFWSLSQDPFIARHGVIAANGETRKRQLIWQRVDADMAGRSDLRTLVGVEVPAYVTIPMPSGDGMAHMTLG
ncbi:PAS domain-containing protein [Rubrivirga sp. IMCC45206]|uniref:PAS domain-containing protein n=1 Tax=Rubrivirga sp. IMCC45206 TaxID=3391614 RepID=UPI00398FC3EF